MKKCLKFSPKRKVKLRFNTEKAQERQAGLRPSGPPLALESVGCPDRSGVATGIFGGLVREWGEKHEAVFPVSERARLPVRAFENLDTALQAVFKLAKDNFLPA